MEVILSCGSGQFEPSELLVTIAQYILFPCFLFQAVSFSVGDVWGQGLMWDFFHWPVLAHLLPDQEHVTERIPGSHWNLSLSHHDHKTGFRVSGVPRNCLTPKLQGNPPASHQQDQNLKEPWWLMRTNQNHSTTTIFANSSLLVVSKSERGREAGRWAVPL